MSWTDENSEDHLAGDMLLGWITDGEYQALERVIVPTGTVTYANVFINAPSDPVTWLLDDASLTRVNCP